MLIEAAFQAVFCPPGGGASLNIYLGYVWCFQNAQRVVFQTHVKGMHGPSKERDIPRLTVESARRHKPKALYLRSTAPSCCQTRRLITVIIIHSSFSPPSSLQTNKSCYLSRFDAGFPVSLFLVLNTQKCFSDILNAIIHF